MLPPASAGSGGGSGTAELDGAAEVCGADDAALDEDDEVADGVADVGGDELDEVLDLVVAEVCVAGDCGLCRSVQDSVRMVSPLMLMLMLSDCAVTV